MSEIEVGSRRNVAFIGHGGEGKTTLADSLLMAAGVTNRLGSVEQGTSFMNYMPEERARRITISDSICSFEHKGLAYTVIDTPGDSNFAGELQAALRAVDSAVLVFSCREGLKVGTEKAYRSAREQGLSVAAVANKMDAPRTDFDASAQALEEALSVRVVKLHFPLSGETAGGGEEYDGYVDLISGKRHNFALDEAGTETVGEPPEALADALLEARMAMIEVIAEADDEMLEKYLENENLDDDEIERTLQKGIRDGSILPLISAAANRNIGGSALLGIAANFLPAPDRAVLPAANSGDEELVLSSDPAGPFAALVFKSTADRYAGTLSILRVISGTLRSDMTILNARTGTRERVSKILGLRCEEALDLPEIGPGGIGALPKLKDTQPGDTLSDEKTQISIAVSPPPRGMISFAVSAKNKGEEDKVFEALNRLLGEDPCLILERDDRTGEFLLTGLGQLHIEVTLDKLRRLFKVDVDLKPPKVPYLETILGRAENIEGKLKKQSGGRGQYGVCYLTVEPGPRGSEVEFRDEIVGGSIPRQFIPAVEKGVREACGRGVISDFPLTDLVVRCIDGKHHAVDSSEMAFKTAGSLGIKAAVMRAKPTLLEPIMDVEVSVPDENVGDIMGNLNSRRGKVAGVDSQGNAQSIRAQVPLAEMLTYASDLTSMTGGQGSFTMHLAQYEEVPASVRERIIAESTKEKEQ